MTRTGTRLTGETGFMDYVDTVIAFVTAHKWWFIAIVPFVVAVAVLKGRG